VFTPGTHSMDAFGVVGTGGICDMSVRVQYKSLL